MKKPESKSENGKRITVKLTLLTVEAHWHELTLRGDAAVLADAGRQDAAALAAWMGETPMPFGLELVNLKTDTNFEVTDGPEIQETEIIERKFGK